MFSQGIRAWNAESEVTSHNLEKQLIDLMPSALHVAAYNGELLKVKYCIDVLHCNPLLLNDDGNSTLHVATDGGQLNIIKYLIEEQKCLPVTPSAHDDSSALHIAAVNGFLPAIKYFIEDMKINPLLSESNNQHKNPLHCACQNGDVGNVDYLLGHAKEYDLIETILNDSTKQEYTMLHFSAASGNFQLVQHLISDFNLDPTTPGQLGATPLLIAAQEGHISIVEYLATLSSCNVNYTLQEKNWNIVHIAASYGHLAIVKLFKNDVNIPDVNGYLPLHLAALNGHIDIVEYLAEECHCDLLCLSKKRETPLHLAALRGHTSVVTYFIVQKQVDPLCESICEITPLHLAVRGGKLEVVLLYVENLNIKLVTPARLGEKLLFQAVHFDHISIVKLLVNKLQWWTSHKRGFRQTQLIIKAVTQGCLEILKFFLAEKHWNIPHKLGSLLHIAAAIGHLKSVKFLIKDLKYDPNSTDCDQLTPLHRACQGGQVEITKFLVFDSMVDINAPAIHGLLPVHIAAGSDNCKLIECLFQSRNLNQKGTDKFGRMAIHYTAMTGKLEPLKYLTSRNRHLVYCNDTLFGRNALHLAVFYGHMSIVKYLVSEMGMDPNIPQAEHPMSTPLHIACIQGHSDIVDYLLNNGNCLKQPCDSIGSRPLHYALYVSKRPIDFIRFLVEEMSFDPMCKDFEGNIPIHEAVQVGNLDLVKYFTDTLNINPRLPNYNGMTPLHFAARSGNLHIVQFLTLQKKCNPMCRENYNNVPAFYAVWFEHYEVLKFFLNELKVNPLVSGDLNQTLFHRAASTGCLKIWNLLASVVNEQHINPNTKDINGITPLHLACKAGHIDIVKQILKHNPCTVLPLDGHEQNPLHYAARTNQLEIIKFLTKEKGFDLLPRDVIGDTPLHFAARRDYLEIVEFYKSQLKSCLQIQNDIGGTPQFLLEHIPVEEVPTQDRTLFIWQQKLGKLII